MTTPKPPCTVPDCDRPPAARGYCARHYGSARRADDRLAVDESRRERVNRLKERRSRGAHIPTERASGPHDGVCSWCGGKLDRRATPTPSRSSDPSARTPQPVCLPCTRRRARVQAILIRAARARVGLTYAEYVKQYGQGRAGFIRAGLTDHDFALAEAEVKAAVGAA